MGNPSVASDAIPRATVYGPFGSAMSMSSDARTVVVGSFSDDDYLGAAWVFTRTGSVWQQQVKLVPSLVANAYAGQAVCMNGDGNALLVGATTWVVGAMRFQ
jgi:hypothetical protein